MFLHLGSLVFFMQLISQRPISTDKDSQEPFRDIREQGLAAATNGGSVARDHVAETVYATGTVPQADFCGM